MNNYYQIDTTINPKIIGKSGLPLTVEITDKRFLEYRKENLLDINKYFDIVNIYVGFPKEIKGKMYQRKRYPIDIMQVMPSCLSLKYIISKNVKKILEDIVNDKSEYHLETLSIEGSDEEFYFLFIPFLKNWENIDYSKTIFYDSLNNKEVIFGSFEKYELEKKVSNFWIKKLYLSNHLEKKDIISIPVAGTFYNERIIDAFQKENIVGYEVIKGGDFKVDLHFD